MVSHVDSPDAKLHRALQMVNEWLRFAEAKNGALLTLNGAAIVGMHSVVKMYETPGLFGQIWLWWATICCLASAALSLSSFYARTKTDAFNFGTPRNTGTSLVYFGDLAEMTKSDLVMRLAPNAGADIRDHLEDVAGQVIINSRITQKKMTLFNLALLVTIAGALTLPGMMLYYYGLCDDKL